MEKMLLVYLFFKDAICSCATCYDTLNARETTFVFALTHTSRNSRLTVAIVISTCRAIRKWIHEWMTRARHVSKYDKLYIIYYTIGSKNE